MFGLSKKNNNIISKIKSNNSDESNHYESDVELLEVFYKNNIDNSTNNEIQLMRVIII